MGGLDALGLLHEHPQALLRVRRAQEAADLHLSQLRGCRSCPAAEEPLLQIQPCVPREAEIGPAVFSQVCPLLYILPLSTLFVETVFLFFFSFLFFLFFWPCFV